MATGYLRRIERLERGGGDRGACVSCAVAGIGSDQPIECDGKSCALGLADLLIGLPVEGESCEMR